MINIKNYKFLDYIMNTNTIKNAIILVAGMGTRLKPLTDTMPKCLTQVNGKTILNNTLDCLANKGIKRIILVTGYLHDKIQETIGNNYLDMEIIYVQNKIYQYTNNMFSLWKVQEFLEEGTILIEGDCFFEEDIIKTLINTNEKSYWAADKFANFKEGCMLTSTEENKIIQIQIIKKSLDEYKENFYKSTGLLKITPELGKKFSKWLDIEVENKNVNIYYDLVLAKYIQEAQIYIHNIHGLKWMEIDDINDLQKAEEIFK